MVSKRTYFTLCLGPALVAQPARDLIQLGKDMFATSAFAEFLFVRSKRIQEHFLLLLVSELQCLLDYVVRILDMTALSGTHLVMQKSSQRRVVGDLLDDLASNRLRGVHQDLLDHIRAVLLAGKLGHTSQHAASDPLGLLLFSVLD